MLHTHFSDKSLSRAGSLFTDKDKFLHTSGLPFRFGCHQHLGKNALAAVIGMHHAGQLFVGGTMTVQQQVADQRAVFIIEKVARSIAWRSTLLYPTDAHMQMFSVVANIGKLLDLLHLGVSKHLFFI